MYIKTHGDRCFALLVGSGIDSCQIDLHLCEDLGNIHQHAGTVVDIDFNLCREPLIGILGFCLLPLRIDQTCPLFCTQIDDVDTVRPVDGNTLFLW